MNQDLDHIKLLSVFHYVVGGLAALFACFPIIHLIMGIMFVVTPGTWDSQGEPFPALFGWFFILFAGAFILAGWALAVCIIVAGRYLSKQMHYLFCLVIAGIECIFMPFGTVLGVFTIIVLMRPSVKELFTPNPSTERTG